MSVLVGYLLIFKYQTNAALIIQGSIDKSELSLQAILNNSHLTEQIVLWVAWSTQQILNYHERRKVENFAKCDFTEPSTLNMKSS